MSDKYTFNGEQFNTVTEALRDNQVCIMGKNGDGTFEIIEGCDKWFGLTLTRQQLIDYANELLELAGS